MPSPGLQSREVVVVAQREPETSQATFTPPAYLQVPAGSRILLCTRCDGGYVRKKYGRHLRDTHHLTGKVKKSVLAWLATEDIAEEELDVVTPPPGQPPIPGLAVLDGLTCKVGSCIYLTTSEPLFDVA